MRNVLRKSVLILMIANTTMAALFWVYFAMFPEIDHCSLGFSSEMPPGVRVEVYRDFGGQPFVSIYLTWRSANAVNLAPGYWFRYSSPPSPLIGNISVSDIDWRQRGQNGDGWRIFVPVIYLVVGFAAYPVLLIAYSLILRFRSRQPGFCRTCSYDLTGNESGTCPECGTAIESDHQQGLS